MSGNLRRGLGWAALAGPAAGAALVALHLSGISPLAPLAPVRDLIRLAQEQPQAIGEAVGWSLGALLLNGLIWARLLTLLGYKRPLGVGLRVFLGSDLAGQVANVPGAAVGCAVGLRRQGVCPGRAVVLSLIANLLGFCSILVWVPVGLLLLSRTGMARAVPLPGHDTVFAAAGLLLCAMAASVIGLQALASAGTVGNRLARRLLHRAPAVTPTEAPIRLRQLLALVPWSALSWLSGALALYAILGALAPDTTLNVGDVVGAAAMAAMLGSLAFFIPAGIGVRDGVLVALLTHSTGLPLATCAGAAIAIRALDPITKIGVFALLALGVPERGRALLARLPLPTWRRVRIPLLPTRVPAPAWIPVRNRE